jgi:hypothetical protein
MQAYGSVRCRTKQKAGLEKGRYLPEPLDRPYLRLGRTEKAEAALVFIKVSYQII